MNSVHHFNPQTHPVIAIDLDGTIWEDDFPNISEPYPHAIETINDLIDNGYEILIWTSRGGENLDVCKDHLIKTFGLNSNIKWNEHSKWFTDRYEVQSPKIGAHVYIDDKALGSPFFYGVEKPNWLDIRLHFIGGKNG